MRRGTTPEVVLELTSDDGSPLDLTDYELHVTFEQRGVYGVELTLTDDDLQVTTEEDATIVTAPLTQEQTLAFRSDKTIYVQLRAKDQQGNAIASEIAEFPAEEILLEGVI